jgi:hypothetical protein
MICLVLLGIILMFFLVQLSMLFFHLGDDLNHHDNFTLAKSLGKELLNCNLRFVATKIVEQQLISILNESKVRFCLELKSSVGNEFGHKWGVD